jgi:LemA protein
VELLLILFIIIAVAFIGLYNGIVTASNRAQHAWADVLVYERRKIKVLDELQQPLSSFMAHEDQLLKKITQLRSAITNLPASADGSALTEVQGATRDLQRSLALTVEAYPDIKSGSLIGSMMSEIVEQQAEVAAAIAVFNREVELFNNSIQIFPGAVVNKLLNKKSAISTFVDSEASSSFDYRPNF